MPTALMPNTEFNIAEPILDSQDRQLYLKLRGRAYRLLARREHSAWELRDKLQNKLRDKLQDKPAEIPPKMVDELLAELVERGEQSDLRFAEQQGRGHWESGRGPLKIRHKLAQHHIEKSLVERVMAAYETRWRGLAAEVRRKKFGDRESANYREWAKQARFLQQRGFTSEQIEPWDGPEQNADS